MDTGKEFSSWESFMHALDQYSKENKVVYVVGMCKPVETANKNEALKDKFPAKFKYCFAQMLCKHSSSYNSKSTEQKPHQRTCQAGCTSSIFVSVNKKRTALVIKEANLEHAHDVSGNILNKSVQDHSLQGEELHMASVLLRFGVPVSRVQEFISCMSSKAQRSENLQSIMTSMRGSSSVKEGHEFAFLTDLDQLMAKDPESIVEMINFALVPGALYIQTSEMTERMKSLQGGRLQIVTHCINDGKISVVSVVGVDSDLNTHILAVCIIIVDAAAVFHHFLESFVRHNSVFCDSLIGVVLDCSKESAEYLQQLIPQVCVAWSRSYILEKFAEEVKNSKKDIHKNMQLRKELMNADSEEAYEKKLKEFIDNISSTESKDFLRTWDLCKELWAQYEISSHLGLQHQKSAVEMDYINFLKAFVSPSMSLSDLIRAVLKLNRSEEQEDEAKETAVFTDPSYEQYRQFCFPEIALAVICQISIAVSSTYVFKEQTDMIFVKKEDTGDEFILNASGTKCVCRYFLASDLPCQHIFAWLHFCNKPLYNESLIPTKWQVFGESITLDALAESLAQGQVPSAQQHDERLKELQLVLKDTLSLCCTHSFQQMGKDLILLKQVLNVMRNNLVHTADLYLHPEERTCQETTPDEASNLARNPRKRGRPSKKDKLQKDQQLLALQDKNVSPTPKRETLSVSRKHNLRTNIKHKFVTRTLHTTDEEISKIPGKLGRQETEYDGNKSISDILNEDQTQLPRTVVQKIDFCKPSVGQISSFALEYQSSATNDTLHSSEIDRKDERTAGVTCEDNFVEISRPRHLVESKGYSQTGFGARVSQEANRSLLVSLSGDKRPYPVSQNDDMVGNDESETVDDELDEMGSTEEDSSDDESDIETQVSKRARTQKEIETFVCSLPHKLIAEVMLVTSVLKSQEERGQGTLSGSQDNRNSAADVLVRACQSKAEHIDFIMSHIRETCPGYNKYAYEVAASVICKAFLTHTSVTVMLQSISDWPNHLPDLIASRPFETEVTLAEGQTLTVCGHKLSQSDVGTLRPDQEISPKVLHAYLEILAQKHSGKMLVIPFDVILEWREGRFSRNIFRKVHFKTFEYLILPIHCGAEFTAVERSGDIVDPCWMALVADVKQRTVSMMNPRSEDKYVIAANGYMLQWRRYMQIRSVHTGEMLSSWSTRWIECSILENNINSGILLLMNVEALINGVPPVVMTEAHIPNYFHLVAVALRDMDRETTVLCVGGPECQQLAARDADWLQCENCCTWWHHVCARHLDTEKPFYCSPCQQRIAMVGGKREVECDEDEEEQADDVDKEAENEDKQLLEDQDMVEKTAIQESR